MGLLLLRSGVGLRLLFSEGDMLRFLLGGVLLRRLGGGEPRGLGGGGDRLIRIGDFRGDFLMLSLALGSE